MAVEKFPDEISAIRTMLSEHPEGLTIRSISAMLGMNRNSTAKYLDILQMQGGVTFRRSGPAKIYCLADKLPAAAVLKLAKSHVIIFNHDLSVTDINDSFSRLLKISKKEIIGKTLGHLPFAVQNLPELRTLIRDGVRGSESRTSTLITIGDRAIPCNLACSPVFFENGNNGVSLVIDLGSEAKDREITGNYADDSLAELDVSEYICRFAPDGTFTYVNKAYCDLLHKTKAEFIGHIWRPTLPESEVRKIKSCLHALDPVHPVVSLDIRAIMRTGDSQWQRWKFRLLTDYDGHSAGYQCTGLDITELKKLEQKTNKGAEEMETFIRERKAEIQDLNKQIYDEIASHEKTHFQLQFTQFAMDKASYMIMWITREGRFVYMNKEAQNVLGYQYRDVITKKFPDLIAGFFSFPWDEIWETIKRDRQFTLETALKTNRGTEIPVEMVFNYLEFKEKHYCCCFARDITGRKEAEEALRQSEQKYRDIFEKSVSGLFKTTPDGCLIDANDAFARMYGYSGATEILAAGLDVGRDLYARPEDRNEMLKLLAEKSKVENFETRHIKRDGTAFWVAITARTIRDNDGNVAFYEGTFVDITGRKLAENSLRNSEARLNTLIKTIPDLIWLKDKDGIYLSCNPVFERLYGAKEIDIVGKNDYDFVDRILADFFREHDQNAIEAGKPTSNEEWLTFADDSHRALIDTIKTPMYDDRGTLIGVLGIGRDITERKRAEDALHEVARYTRNLLESSLDPMVTISAEGRIMDVNTATEWATGYSRENLIGTDFSDYFMVPENARKSYLQVFEKGVVRDYPLEIKNRDGTIRNVLYNATIYRDSSGSVKGVFAAARDITERRKAETELQLHGEIVQNLAEGVVMIRISDGTIVYANPRFEIMSGYSPGELNGRHISTINAPDGRSPETVANEIISNLRQTGLWSGDVLNIRKDGTMFRCHATVSAFDHPQHGPVWISVHLDITERKQAEDEIFFKNLLLLTQQETSPDGILVVDERGKILSFNRHFAGVWDIPQEVIASGLDELAISAVQDKLVDPEEFLARVRHLYTHKTEKSHDEILLKDGRILDRYSAPMFGDRKKYFGRVWYFRDITERKRAEEALKMANRKLNLFSTITRHDIINQMTLLRGFARRLERELPAHNLDEYFQKINTSADRISAMIQFTKTYENIGINLPVWRDVGSLVDAAVKDVELGNVRLDNEIPAGTEVFADPLIASVFHNLLNNALVLGGPVSAISFSSEDLNGNRLIVCENDGSGVPAEEKEKIFELGYGRNTGFNLFLFREILGITGITLKETGMPGRGLRFEITVPEGMHRYLSQGSPE